MDKIKKRIFELFDVIEKNKEVKLVDIAYEELKSIKNKIGEENYEKLISPQPIHPSKQSSKIMCIKGEFYISSNDN